MSPIAKQNRGNRAKKNPVGSKDNQTISTNQKPNRRSRKKRIALSDEQKENIRSKMKKVESLFTEDQEQLSSARNERDTTKARLDMVEVELKETKVELKETKDRLIAAEKTIETLQKSVEELQKRMEHNTSTRVNDPYTSTIYDPSTYTSEGTIPEDVTVNFSQEVVEGATCNLCLNVESNVLCFECCNKTLKTEYVNTLKHMSTFAPTCVQPFNRKE